MGDNITPGSPTRGILFNDKENGVEYCIMQKIHVESCLDIIAKSFIQGEPLTQKLGVTLQDWRKFAAIWIHRMALEGRSVVAIDTNTDKILGVFLNEDFQNADPPGIGAFLEGVGGEWEAVLGIISKLEDALMSKYNIPEEPANRQSGQFFHMWLTGVAPEGRGRGIGRNLFIRSCMLAKEQGFQMAFAECSNEISTHLFRKYLGGKTEAFVDYSTYDGPCSKAVNDVAKSGHKGASMMTVDLASNNFE